MTFAIGARSQLGYVVETTYGTTPATPSLLELVATGHSLNMNRSEFDDNSIRPDRMERYSLSGNKSIAGSVNVNFAHSIFDDMLTSLTQGTWTSNVLKTGTTRTSFSMEAANYDVAQFVVYSGMVVDKMTLTVPSDGIVTAQFDFLGKAQTAFSGTSIDTTSNGGLVGNYTPAANKTPFTDNSASGFVKEGGSAIGYVTAWSLTYDNGMTPQFAVGSDTMYDLTSSNAKVTGSVTIYFQDAVMYNKFLNQTASSLDLKLSDGTNSIEFLVPNVKYTGATRTISGNGPVTVTMPFKGLYDTTTQSNLVITRT